MVYSDLFNHKVSSLLELSCGALGQSCWQRILCLFATYQNERFGFASKAWLPLQIIFNGPWGSSSVQILSIFHKTSSQLPTTSQEHFVWKDATALCCVTWEGEKSLLLAQDCHNLDESSAELCFCWVHRIKGESNSNSQFWLSLTFLITLKYFPNFYTAVNLSSLRFQSALDNRRYTFC